MYVQAARLVGLGLFALWGLVSCTKEDEKSAPQPPPKPTPSATPPSPPREYTLGFAEKSVAHDFYQAIIKKWGATDKNKLREAHEKLDQGCLKKGKIEGKDDYKIASCEVFEPVLKNHKEYHDLNKGMDNGALLWILDDNDPKTDSDAKIRERIDAALQTLYNLEIIKNLETDSDERRVKLATALFYFADFPKNPKAIPHQWPKLRERTLKLREMGLGDFQDKLFETGGLGAGDLAQLPRTALAEAALIALNDPSVRGTDLTKANILFGVFEHAGLKPEFYSVPMKYADPYQDEEVIRQIPNIYLENQIVVGIPLKEGAQATDTPAQEPTDATAEEPANVRIFNLKTLDPHGEYQEMQRVQRSAILAKNLGSKGYEYLLTYENTKVALFLLKRAIDFTPDAAGAHNNLGVILARLQKKDEAKAAYEQAIQLEPGFPWARFNLGKILIAEKNFKEGLEHYLSVVKTHPKMITPTGRQDMLRDAEYAETLEPSKAIAEQLIAEINKLSPAP
jgi:tetratricopeptide (TPR) repeat protein